MVFGGYAGYAATLGTIPGLETWAILNLRCP